jgi:hypothetical protein
MLFPSKRHELASRAKAIAATVDGSALRADGLIADEVDRFDATKAGITVGQEQRLSDGMGKVMVKHKEEPPNNCWN